MEGLHAGPFALKPNRDEAELILGRPLPGLVEQVWAARELQAKHGITWVTISDGAAGALLLGPDGLAHHGQYRGPPLEIGGGFFMGPSLWAKSFFFSSPRPLSVALGPRSE